MIRLSEIIKSIEEEEQSGLVQLDDWKLSEVDYLIDMGFDQDGEHKMSLHEPEMTIYKKKGVTHKLTNEIQAVGEGYVVEDKSKKKSHVFPTFKHMVEFFDNYEQDFKS